jgi:hypothetical protein
MRHKNKESWAMNRRGGKAKLAAGFVGILLAGFLLAGRAQTAPPDASIVQRVANQNPAPLPTGFLGSDYALLKRGQPGSRREAMLAYINPSANRRTARYSLLSWPRRSSFAHIEADEVNRRNAIFGSTDLTIADARMPANGIRPLFRPLLEIQLGAYKLPIFLYVPNPQANRPSW